MQPRQFNLQVIFALLTILIAGCATTTDTVPQGYLFTYIRTPYTVDLNNTPTNFTKMNVETVFIGQDNGSTSATTENTMLINKTPLMTDTQIQQRAGKVIKFTEPFSGYGIYTELNTNAIADIAKRHGMNEVYFADMEILDILGIWRHNKLYIYGR